MTWLEWFWGTLERPIKIGDQTLAFSWLAIILEWTLPVVAALLLLLWLGRVTNRKIAAMDGSDERKVRYSGLFRLGSRLVFVLFVILLSVRFMEESILVFFQDFFLMLGTPFYKSGSTQISVMTLILAIPVILLANLGGRAARAALERSKMFVHNISESRRQTMANLLRYGVMVIALLLGLSVIGLDLTAIMILLGVFGVGIGFGLQHTLASFFAGLTIVINRPFKEGDYLRLELDGEKREGTVKAIRLINTLLVTAENELMVIPNSSLMHQSLGNLSYLEHQYCLNLEVVVDQQADLGQVRALLLAVAARCDLASPLNPPVLRTAGVKDGGVHFVVVLYLQSPQDRDMVKSWYADELLEACRKEKIRLVGIS